jgi:glutaconyl-CoA/methylmalonyl-CoA decarboxylase subunit gamma
MKKFKFLINGNNYEVSVMKFDKNLAEIEVNGTPYQVEVQGEVKASKTPTLVRAAATPSRQESKIKKVIGSGGALKSPLPGSIIKVLVNVGDTVAKGDKLIIMEAMKMENNVLAEKDGTITSIKVKAGDTVLQNDTLLEMQ